MAVGPTLAGSFIDLMGVRAGFVAGGTVAFLLAIAVLCSTLLCVLNHVGENRATPAEMAITRAVLMAVAAADVQHKGALQMAIDEHRDDITSGKTVLRKHSEK